MSALTDEEIRIRYLDGESARSLAVQAGISGQTVVRRLVALGVELRPEGQRKLRLPLDEMRHRYLAGERLLDLATEAGTSSQTVGRRLQ